MTHLRQHHERQLGALHVAGNPRIDAREFPPPVPGPVTERLARRFARMIAGEDAAFSPRWMQAVA